MGLKSAVQKRIASRKKPKSNRQYVPDWQKHSISTHRQKFGGPYTRSVTDEELEYLSLRDQVGYKVTKKPAQDALKRPPIVKSDDKPFVEAITKMMGDINFYTDLMQAYRMARQQGHSLLALAVESPTPLDQSPEGVTGIAAVTPISKQRVVKRHIDTDPSSPTYGHILKYRIRFNVDSIYVERDIHADRILHIMADRHNTDMDGVPILLPIFDNLQVKKNMDLSFGEAAYSYARPTTLVELPEDATEDEFDDMEENFYMEDRNEFIAPYGYKFSQLHAKHALDPKNYYEVMWDSIAAGTEFSSQNLRGSSAGSVTGSWTNQAEYFSEIGDIQKLVIEPYIVEFIRRCQAWGLLADMDFELDWPTLWELDDKEKSEIKVNEALSAVREASTLKTYLGPEFKEAGFKVEFDETGWYVSQGKNQMRLFDYKTNRVEVKSETTKYNKLGLNRTVAQAQEQWKKWGYNPGSIEMRYGGKLRDGYSNILESLWDQAEEILNKHLPGRDNALTPNEAKLAREIYTNPDLRELGDKKTLKRVDEMAEAIDAIMKELKIAKKLDMNVTFEEMMKDSHQFGWVATEVPLGVDEPWMLPDEDAVQYLQRSRLLWEQKKNDTLGSAKYQLIEGIRAGESYEQIKSRLTDAVTKVSNVDTFVRTEVHIAAEQGRLSLYEKNGVEWVEWLTAGDERVRPEHMQRDGRIIHISEARSLINDPNCRCTYLPAKKPGGAS